VIISDHKWSICDQFVMNLCTMIYYGSLQLLDLAMDFPCIQGTGPRGHWRIRDVGDVGDGDPGDLSVMANGRCSWWFYRSIVVNNNGLYIWSIYGHYRSKYFHGFRDHKWWFFRDLMMFTIVYPSWLWDFMGFTVTIDIYRWDNSIHR